MPDFKLRPYQTTIIESARAAMRAGSRSILLQAPTGAGKTALSAHMLGTSSQRGVVSWFVCHRLDGTGLHQWFNTLIEGPCVSWLIERGFLSRYRLFAPSRPDLSGVGSRMGDFIKSETSKAMDRPSITGDAVAHYKKLASGERAMVFCSSIQHSQHVVAQFVAAGIPAEHVDGETGPSDRDAAMRRFDRGETLILSNVDLFGEGVDVPGAVVLIDLAPTQSLTRCLQRWGRVLRPAPGKTEAVILDHAGNATERHGLPDDQREWSLEGSKKRKNKDPDDVPVKQCPKCFTVVRTQVQTCRCGHVWVAAPRVVEERGGDLQEVDPEVLRRQRSIEQGTARSLEDLIKLGFKRGYKNPRFWAEKVYNARKRA